MAETTVKAGPRRGGGGKVFEDQASCDVILDGFSDVLQHHHYPLSLCFLALPLYLIYTW